MTNGFNLDHNLDLWILKVKGDLDFGPHTWTWPWIFMVKFWNSCIADWEGRLTLHKGDGSRSFITMTMTIWWPKSGVWIYQIVSGVTSVVSVMSTHLVLYVISLLHGQFGRNLIYVLLLFLMCYLLHFILLVDVSLHMVCSPKCGSCGCKFLYGGDRSTMNFVLETWWHLCINNAELPVNFLQKLYVVGWLVLFPSAKSKTVKPLV